MMTRYEILPGKLHKGGSVGVEVLPDSSKFSIKVNFSIDKKMLVPVPGEFLKGEYTLDLPNAFKDERGYLELEQRGTVEVPKARIQFLQRRDLDHYKNTMEADVIPVNGKFKLKAFYHPDIPGVGWARVELVFLMDVPGLKNYDITAILKSS